MGPRNPVKRGFSLFSDDFWLQVIEAVLTIASFNVRVFVSHLKDDGAGWKVQEEAGWVGMSGACRCLLLAVLLVTPHDRGVAWPAGSPTHYALLYLA